MSTANPNPTPDQVGNNVMNAIFGTPTCVNRWANFGMYILFAAVAAVIFALLAFVPLNRYSYFKNPNAHLGAKSVLFFFIIWLLIWLFAMWFQKHPACDEK